MVAADVRTIENVQYGRIGNGLVCVILVPGLASGTWIYDNLASRLAGNYVVIRVLLAGMAGSACGPGPALPRAIKALRTIIEQQAGPVVIAAHSLGGAIAMAVMTDAPDNLVGFVALDAGPRPWKSPELPRLHNEICAAAAELFSDQNCREIGGALEEWIRQMASNKTDQDRLIQDFRSSPTDLLREVYSEGRKQQLSLSRSRFVIPFLVLVACKHESECDRYRADFAARYLNAADVTIITVPASRHYVMLDQPEATAQAVTQFLARFA